MYPYTGLVDDFRFQGPHEYMSEEHRAHLDEMKKMLRDDWRPSLVAYKKAAKIWNRL
jgi:hypothetical protein